MNRWFIQNGDLSGFGCLIAGEFVVAVALILIGTGVA